MLDNTCFKKAGRFKRVQLDHSTRYFLDLTPVEFKILLKHQTILHPLFLSFCCCCCIFFCFCYTVATVAVVTVVVFVVSVVLFLLPYLQAVDIVEGPK